MSSLLRILLLLAASSSAGLPALASAEDWPHWRGPERSGITSENSQFREGQPWLSKEPQWSFEAGEGSTSPLVVDGKVYVLGWKDGTDSLHCLDLETGKNLWQASWPSPRHGRFAVGDERRYGGPTSSPEYDPETGLLFTLSCDGELRAWDPVKGGDPVWRKNLYDTYGVGQRPKTGGGLRDYGYTTSPLVIDGRLLVEVGSSEGTVMAFDPAIGSELWRSEYREPAGHTGGLVPITVEGESCVALLSLYHLVILDLEPGREGKTRSLHPWKTDWANNILTPTVHGNEVLISSYHTHRAIRKLRVTKSGIEKVWEELFASHVGSPLVRDGKVYFAGRQLYCLDWETGKLDWEGGIFGDGASLIHTADDRLLAFGGDCSLTLVDSFRRSPDEYEERARISGVTAGGPGDAWPHVILAKGWVLCKNRQGQLTARRLP